MHWAAALAGRAASALRIVWCRDGTGDDAYVVGDDLDAIAEGDISPIDAVAASVRVNHPALTVSTTVIAGSPRDVLRAHSQDPDLLVVGHSHHPGAVRFWQGTTTQWLSRHTDCPVVMVPTQTPPDAPTRVLVGVDGSAASLAAAAWAADEAALVMCELVVLHAWESAYRAVDPASEQARDVTRLDAAGALARAVEVAREHTAGSVTSVLVESRPAAALLDAARPGDIVVIGASGHGVVSANLVGSTVNHLLDRSPVPVVVVR